MRRGVGRRCLSLQFFAVLAPATCAPPAAGTPTSSRRASGPATGTSPTSGWATCTGSTAVRARTGPTGCRPVGRFRSTPQSRPHTSTHRPRGAGPHACARRPSRPSSLTGTRTRSRRGAGTTSGPVPTPGRAHRSAHRSTASARRAGSPGRTRAVPGPTGTTRRVRSAVSCRRPSGPPTTVRRPSTIPLGVGGPPHGGRDRLSGQGRYRTPEPRRWRYRLAGDRRHRRPALGPRCIRADGRAGGPMRRCDALTSLGRLASRRRRSASGSHTGRRHRRRGGMTRDDGHSRRFLAGGRMNGRPMSTYTGRGRSLGCRSLRCRRVRCRRVRCRSRRGCGRVGSRL